MANSKLNLDELIEEIDTVDEPIVSIPAVPSTPVTAPATTPATKPAVKDIKVIIDSCFKSNAEKGTKGYLRGSMLVEETRTCKSIKLLVDANAKVVPLTAESLRKVRESYATKNPDKDILWKGVPDPALGSTIFIVSVDEDSTVVKVEYRYPKVDQGKRAKSVNWDDVIDTDDITNVL